ncbi:hypothetical protein PM082_005098 [Marasmius tenuissimus]|nr:hypothetical protein PM082_005098 [Marasmius tenuissimus]
MYSALLKTPPPTDFLKNEEKRQRRLVQLPMAKLGRQLNRQGRFCLWSTLRIVISLAWTSLVNSGLSNIYVV